MDVRVWMSAGGPGLGGSLGAHGGPKRGEGVGVRGGDGGDCVCVCCVCMCVAVAYFPELRSSLIRPNWAYSGLREFVKLP